MASSSEVRALLQGEVSDDHELWIVKVPKSKVPAVHCLSVDFASGVSVDTDNGMAAKVSKKKSKHIVINADAEGKCTMSPVTTRGEIIVTETVEPPSYYKKAIPDTSVVKVKQPEGLRSTHPLLGPEKKKVKRQKK